MNTLYLAHNFELRRIIRKWELRMEAKYNINIDNPFYDNSNRAAEMTVIDNMKDGSKEQREYLATRDKDSIVHDDLEKIRKSDGIIAMANVTRIGTPMEIFFSSYLLRLPTLVVTKNYNCHPWIRKFATRTFPHRTALEKYIKEKYGLKHGL